MTCSKKTKSKGFTLVELVVVMAILSIFFGMIWSFLKPTSEMYAETNAYAAQENIVFNIKNTLDSELRYATNVLILDDYSGQPKLDKISSGNYNYCIVIDNSAKRTGLDIAKNLNSKGVIWKYDYTSSGLTNKQQLFSDGYLDKYTYTFTIDSDYHPNSAVKSDDGVYSCKIDIKSSTNVFENGSPTGSKKGVETSAAISFDNINTLKELGSSTSYSVTYFKPANTSDYNSYPKQSEGSSCTYIFYKRLAQNETT